MDDNKVIKFGEKLSLKGHIQLRSSIGIRLFCLIQN